MDTSLSLVLRQLWSNGLNLRDCYEAHVATFPTSQSTLWQRYPRWWMRVDRFRPSGRGPAIKWPRCRWLLRFQRRVCRAHGSWRRVPNCSRRAAKVCSVIGTPLDCCWFSSRRRTTKSCNIEARRNAPRGLSVTWESTLRIVF